MSPMNYPMPGIPSPPPAPRKRHIFRNIMIVLGSFVAVIVVISVAVGVSTSSKIAGGVSPPPVAAYSPAPDASSAPAAPAAAAPVRVLVHFTVTGTGDPSITYGSDSDSITPAGSLGPLGDGVALPFRDHLVFDPTAQFYDIDAQLEGGGSLTCRIWISAPGYSDTTVAIGHASGGYNICSAQAAPSDTTGLTWSAE